MQVSLVFRSSISKLLTCLQTYDAHLNVGTLSMFIYTLFKLLMGLDSWNTFICGAFITPPVVWGTLLCLAGVIISTISSGTANSCSFSAHISEWEEQIRTDWSCQGIWKQLLHYKHVWQQMTGNIVDTRCGHIDTTKEVTLIFLVVYSWKDEAFRANTAWWFILRHSDSCSRSLYHSPAQLRL